MLSVGCDDDHQASRHTYHQQQDLEHHRRGATQSSTEGPLQSAFEIELHAWSAKSHSPRFSHMCTHINILGIYPSFDEDSKHECSEDGPQYPPEPPAPGALGLILRRLEQLSLLMLIPPLVVGGGEQGRLLRVGIPSRPGGGPRR